MAANAKRLSDAAEAAAKWRAEHPETPLTGQQATMLEASLSGYYPLAGLGGMFGGRG